MPPSWGPYNEDPTMLTGRLRRKVHLKTPDATVLLFFVRACGPKP